MLLGPELISWVNSSEKRDNSYGSRPSKSGLGLMIVKRILWLHQSSLIVDIKEHHNLFSFEMPIVTPHKIQ